MKKIFMILLLAFLFTACNNESKTTDATTAGADTAATAKQAPVELLGDELNAASKAIWENFSKGDADAMTANFDDNARMNFSGGDTLVGKKAITDYYKGRWKILETLKFSDEIWLPIKANQSPNGITQTGKWMLSWHRVDAKYKNGKSITFWAHNATHFSDAGKVDFIAQYIDRHPIIEATKDLMK